MLKAERRVDDEGSIESFFFFFVCGIILFVTVATHQGQFSRMDRLQMATVVLFARLLFRDIVHLELNP